MAVTVGKTRIQDGMEQANKPMIRPSKHPTDLNVELRSNVPDSMLRAQEFKIRRLLLPSRT